MMNLKHSLKRQLSNIPRWLPITIGIVALLGFADATYLAVEHFSNTIPPCAAGSCELVLTSPYSTVFGIPDSLLGALYYLFILVLVVLYFDAKKEIYLRIALFCTLAGVISSAAFVWLMAFVIHAYCQYCLASAATSTTLFIVAVFALCRYRTAEVATSEK